LVISYRRLGFVKVNLTLGTVPDNVKSVKAAIRYPGVVDPSAQQQFELTREKPTAAYFTYTGKTGEPGPTSTSSPTSWRTGRRWTCPSRAARPKSWPSRPLRAHCCRPLPGAGRFHVVEKIIVDARYADPAHDLTGTFPC